MSPEKVREFIHTAETMEELNAANIMVIDLNLDVLKPEDFYMWKFHIGREMNKRCLELCGNMYYPDSCSCSHVPGRNPPAYSDEDWLIKDGSWSADGIWKSGGSWANMPV